MNYEMKGEHSVCCAASSRNAGSSDVEGEAGASEVDCVTRRTLNHEMSFTTISADKDSRCLQ